AEFPADVVGGAARDGAEVVLAVRAQARGTGLDEVAVAVQLVAPREVAVATRLSGPAEVGVEVAVGLLRRGQPRAPVGDRARGERVPRPRGFPRACLERLVELRVGELAAPAAGGGAVRGEH